MSQSFYLSGTVDNLTATSSPIQMVLDDKRPGDNLATIDKNKTAWMTVCGPLLARELGTNLWMGGDKFSVLGGFQLLDLIIMELKSHMTC